MKNLLFIGVDQLRHDVVGPDKTVPVETPNLDRLMARGASFSRTYATSPLCTPARASMFTGDYAFRHGMGTNCDMYHALGTELREPERLIHRDLQHAGYRCGFVGKWHVGVAKTPADYGFEGDVPAGYGNLTKTESYSRYLAEHNLRYVVEPTLFFNPDQQTLAGGRWRGPVGSTPCYFQTSQAIEMLDDFAGEQYLTSRWPAAEPTFNGKRVAVIGTGSSGIQVISEVAQQAGQLYVLQRTPSFTIPLRNRPVEPGHASKMKKQ